MKLKHALLAMSAGAMIVAPAVAQAGTAASTSVGKIANLSGVGERQSAPVAKKQKASAGLVLLALLAGAAAVYGVTELADDDDEPASLGS